MGLIGLPVLVTAVVAIVLAAQARRRSLELRRELEELRLAEREDREALAALRLEVTSLTSPREARRLPGGAEGPATSTGSSPAGAPVTSTTDTMPRAAIEATGASPAGSRPRSAVPPPERATPPPPPERPSIDWEAWLGVRGAAWLGAVALVIAGSLFVKYSVEHDLVPPALRVATILLTGLGSIVGAELSLRRRYAVTANAAAGAGVALLYAGLFAAHSLYELLPTLPTFALMVLVTAVAVLLSIRYDARVVAIIGLLGGFATPIAVSTGRDNPVGLFSYVLLLNAGLFWVFVRKGWHRLSILSLTATIAVGIGWAAKYLEPHKLPIAAAAFGVLALAYLTLPLLAKKPDRTLARVALAAGHAPFLLALLVAHDPAYASSWPVAFGLVACLDVAFAALLLRRNEVTLYAGGAVATAVFLVVQATAQLERGVGLGPSLAAAALVVLVNAATLLAPRLAREPLAPRSIVELGGVAAGLGLAVWTFALTARGLGDPALPTVATLAALLAVAALRSGAEGVPAAIVGAPPVVSLVAGMWFIAGAGGFSYDELRDALPLAPDQALDPAWLPWRNVAVLVAVPLVSTLVTLARRRSPLVAARLHEAAGALAGVGVTGAFLAGALASRDTGWRLGPLAFGLVVLVGLLLYLALRRGWAALAPAAALAAGGFCAAWEHAFGDAAQAWVALGVYLGLYLALLLYPFAVTRWLRPAWREEVAPWLAAALAGPLLFWPVYDVVVRRLGSLAIGLLPLGFAVLTVAALYRVYVVFRDADPSAPLARARLRNLALFAAVALGFVGVAIPLQLERQWITLGWALEAMAAVWLFGRLPHPGLKYLAAVLYGAVFVRLVLNPAVLEYHERGQRVLNWILYTYGVAATTFLVGSALLGRLERRRLEPWEERLYPKRFGIAEVAGALGLVVVFVLVSLEIADWFSAGRAIEWDWERRPARDLTLSLGWGVYALALLVAGIVRRGRGLRVASLAFMLLAIGKVFFYDLSSLQGLYRVLSLFGLAVALILVSLVYQRFVFPRGSPVAGAAPEASP